METENFDVVVAGGGSAGLCAALQCAREGLKTLLVEKTGICGGAITLAGISYPGIFGVCGRQIIAGIGWELVHAALAEMNAPEPDFSRCNDGGNANGHIAINGFVFAALADQALIKAGAQVLFHTMPAAMKREENAWRITLCDKDGLHDIRCQIAIDCTGDANLVKMAGAAYREPEICQPGSLSVKVEGRPGALPENACLDELKQEYLAAVERGELCASDFGWSGDFSLGPLFGNNCNHICGINAADSRRKTALEMAGRERVLRVLRFFRKQKGFENLSYILHSAECGVRETRTIIGEETVNGEDYIAGRKFPDAVCHAFYPVDLHDAQRGLIYQKLPAGVIPTVPRGALVPKGEQNLLAAGRILSSDRIANSGLRVQAVAMATGQAAGALAVLRHRMKLPTMQLPMAEVRALLEKHNAIVP